MRCNATDIRCNAESINERACHGRRAEGWLESASLGEVLPESDAELEVTFDCSKKGAENGWTTPAEEGHWLKFRTTPSEGNDDQPDPHKNAYGLPPEGPSQAYDTVAPEYNIMAQASRRRPT